MKRILFLAILLLAGCGGGTVPPVPGPGPVVVPPASSHNNDAGSEIPDSTSELIDAASDGATEGMTGDGSSEALGPKYPEGLEHLALLDSVTDQTAAIYAYLKNLGYDWRESLEKPNQLADKSCLFAENIAKIQTACDLLRELGAEEQCLPVSYQLDEILNTFSQRAILQVPEERLSMVAGKKPYRNVKAAVSWVLNDGSSMSWSGANVVFDAPYGLLSQENWQTDTQGVVVNEFKTGAVDGQNIRVALDPFTCPALANRWLPPFKTVTLHDLTVATAKVELFFFEEVEQSTAIHQIFTETLLGEFYKLGMKRVSELREYDNLTLQNYRGHEEEALDYLLKQRQKKGDILIFGTVNSDFVSRVGARSVWHEAVVNIQVFDEATGNIIYSGSLSGRATGIGEQDAADNAMSQLAKSLAEKPLFEIIKTYFAR